MHKELLFAQQNMHEYKKNSLHKKTVKSEEYNGF